MHLAERQIYQKVKPYVWGGSYKNRIDQPGQMK